MKRGSFHGLVLGFFCILITNQLQAQLASPGTIYASTSDGAIYEINDDFSQKRLVIETEFADMESLAINTKGEVYTFAQGAVRKIDLKNGGGGEVIPESALPGGRIKAKITFDANDNLFLLFNSELPGLPGWGSYIYAIDEETGEAEPILYYSSTYVPGGDNAEGYGSIAVDLFAGGLYASTPDLTVMTRLRPGHSFSRSVTTGYPASEGNFQNLFSNGRGAIYGFGPGAVVSIDPRSGQTEMIALGVFGYSDMAFAPSTNHPPLDVTISPAIIHKTGLLQHRSGFAQLLLTNRGSSAVEVILQGYDPTLVIFQGAETTYTIPADTSINLTVRISTSTAGAITDTLKFKCQETTYEIPLNVGIREAEEPNPEQTYFLTEDMVLINVSTANWAFGEEAKMNKAFSTVAANSEGRLFGASHNALYEIDGATGRFFLVKLLPFTVKAMTSHNNGDLIIAHNPQDLFEGTTFASLSIYRYSVGSNRLDLKAEDPGPSAPVVSAIAYSPAGELYFLTSTGRAGKAGSFASDLDAPWEFDYDIGHGNGFQSLFFVDARHLVAVTYDDNFLQEKKIKYFDLDKDEVGAVLGIDVKVIATAHPADNTLLATCCESNFGVSVYPNPFSGSVTIEVRIAASGVNMTIEVLDLQGRVVNSVECISKGNSYHATWDGRDTSGNRVPAGIYIVRLQAGNESPVFRRIIYSH